ncbi:hypothetical protein DAMA08_043230 [Martiniozyma asiatica (nom. inval.)]|nr:hypothetical protein DAMA08_043230 [Martiniozyma asiatica]
MQQQEFIPGEQAVEIPEDVLENDLTVAVPEITTVHTVAEFGQNIRNRIRQGEDILHNVNMITLNVNLENPFFQAINTLTTAVNNLNRDMGARLDRMENGMNTRLDALDTRLDRMETAINTRLDALDTRLDRMETAINTRLDALDTRLDALDTRLGNLETRMNTIDKSLQNMEGLMFHARIRENRRRRAGPGDLPQFVVPFIQGQMPEGLPVITSHNSIQRMRVADLRTYLDGYGVNYAPNARKPELILLLQETLGYR